MSFTKQDFENFADKVAESFVSEKSPLNDSILKIAQEHDFNPEQIKRLVEASNVKTFLKLFNTPENKDQNIDFDVANADDIMNSFYSSNKNPGIKSVTLTKVTVSKGSSMRDPLELFGDMPSFGGSDEIEHYMEPASSESKPSRGVVVLRLKKVAEELTNSIYDQEHEYVENLEKVASEFRKLYGPDYTEFEKVALAKYGDDIVPVLSDIRDMIHWHEPIDPTIEKTASIVFSDTKELQALDKMFSAKQEQLKYAEAVRTVNSKLKAIGAR